MEDNTECVAPESTSNVVSSQFTIYIYLHLHLHSKTSHNEVCFWELSRLRKATLIGVVLMYILMQSLHFQVFEAFFVCVCFVAPSLCLDQLHRPYGCPYPPLALGRCTAGSCELPADCYIVFRLYSATTFEPIIHGASTDAGLSACATSALWLFLPFGSTPRRMHSTLDGPPPLSPLQERLGL